VPILTIAVRDEDRRGRLIRRLIHYAFRLFVEALALGRIITYEINGAEKLRQPGLLIIANHPTLLDVVYLVGFVENAICLVKKNLFDNPFTRFSIRGAQYINNVHPQESIDKCVQALAQGHSTIVFPEGTRTSRGSEIRLQRGAAYVALQSGIDPTPVTISCVPGWLTKEDHWYEVPRFPIRFRFDVRDDLSVQSSYSEATEGLQARRATEVIRQALFDDATHSR
jgi:1-acyl-sn-glycerol-3-phosphate acyltransferase